MKPKDIIDKLDPTKFKCVGCGKFIPIVKKLPYQCPKCTRVYHRISPFQVWEKGYYKDEQGMPCYSTELTHNAKYTLTVKEL